MAKGDNKRTGNRGDWSEIYVLLRILSEGYIFPADENLTRKTDSYFPVLKAIRKEKNTVYEYKPNIYRQKGIYSWRK